jgi:hypothetical protein
MRNEKWIRNKKDDTSVWSVEFVSEGSHSLIATLLHFFEA